MRPWRLRVIGADGGLDRRRTWSGCASASGLVSLLAAGIGFWWAWIDQRPPDLARPRQPYAHRPHAEGWEAY
jgi:hypothetical protein